MSSSVNDFDDALQLDPKTRFALVRFDRRRRRLLLIRAAMIGIVVFVTSMIMIVLLDYFFFLSDAVRWILSIAGYLTTAFVVWRSGLNRYANRDLQQVARQLEAVEPRVADDLLSAVELSDPELANGAQSFRDSLQRSVSSRIARVDVRRLLPIGLIKKWISTGTMIAVVCLLVSLISPLQFPRRLGRAALPGVAIQRASQTVISIVKPNPASGFVAEGDVVAIVAELSGRPADLVTLRWREQGGERGETVMSPRQWVSADGLPPGERSDAAPKRYAANLSFSDRVIEYQLIAGDAVTLWQALTPLPRPRTEQFEIRYQFPSYAKMNDRVETSSHGDLQAFVGTTAEVVVSFDQAVTNAVVRFVGRDLDFPMEPVDSTNRLHRISIPIRSNGQYQISAESVESGLGNPFSPTYSISAITDVAPTVVWQSNDLRSMLASPLDVPRLSVAIRDDMPLASAVQEYSINGQSPVRRDLAIDTQNRELVHEFDWDLTSLSDAKGNALRLAAGDIVRTRVIATDRLGQSSASRILDVLIASEGFDSDRHFRFDELTEIAKEVRTWIQQGRILAGTSDAALTGDSESSEEDASEKILAWSIASEQLIDRIATRLGQSDAVTEASNVELLGLAVANLSRSLVRATLQPSATTDRGKNRGKPTFASSFTQQSERINQMLDSLVGHALTIAVAGDAVLLQRSLTPVADHASDIPVSRIPRYFRVASDRLELIDELIRERSDLIPLSTRRHFQGDAWMAWSEKWAERLDGMVAGEMSEPVVRRVANDFYDELSSRISHSLVDSRLASTNAKLVDSVRQQVGDFSSAIIRMREIGSSLQRTQQSISREKAPAKLDQLNGELANHQATFTAGIAELQKRIETEAELHRQRPVVDLRYAADLSLLDQAIKTVTEGGYRPYQQIPADEIFGRLADAIEIIEGVHHASRYHHQLMSIRDAERDFVDDVDSKISHSFWLDQYRVGIQSLTKRLQKRKAIQPKIRNLDDTRRNSTFSLAKSRIDGRRWSNDPPLSAFRSLDTLANQAAEAIASMQSDVTLAREEILRFVKTLSEQAREAAALASEAAERSETNQDADQQETAEISRRQREAESAAKETVSRLHDRANTADLKDQKQRDLAHDADLSAAAVESALRRAKQSMQEAETESDPESRKSDLQKNASALSELSETLQRVAEHFERAEQGQDASDSRDALRQAIEDSRLREEADLRQRRAEAIAKAAESDPEEMLRRLESALKKDEVMQDELSDIASRAMDAALNKLRQASQQEQSLQRSLERSDPAIAELKKRLNASVRNAALRIEGLDAANMDAAQRSGDLGRNGSVRRQLDDVRKKLQSAITEAQSVGGDQSLLSDMSGVASRVANELDAASSMLQKIVDDVDKSQGKNDSIDSPLQAAQRLKQIDNARRNALIRAITNEQRAWTNAVRETGPRLQQAQRKQRDAKNVISKLEQADDSDDQVARKLQEAKRQLETATRAADEARGTNRFASEKASEASKRMRSVRSEKTPELNPEDLVNEALRNHMEKTMDGLQSIVTEMEQWQVGEESRLPLIAAPDESSRLADRQQSVQTDVAVAGEDIRRAGRHEARLDKPDVAASVEEVANSVSDQSVPATETARKSLEAASENVSKSSVARDDLESASEQIDRSADLLDALLGRNFDKRQGDAARPTASESQSMSDEQSKQLAKTLDELDQAMLSAQPPNQSPPSSSQGAQQGENESSSSSESTSSSQGKPPSESQASSSTPGSAGEASPTLASMLENERQNAARQRRGKPSPGARPGQSTNRRPGEDPTEGASSIEQMGDPALDPAGINRVDEDWGQLRQQAPEDVLQSEWSTVSPQYRREVSAYFRAIAERSAQER